MGKESVGGSEFNSAEISFIDFLEANLGETEMNNFRASLSMNQDQKLFRVNDLMEKHELYKVDRSQATPRVQKAWEIMDNFIAGKSPFFEENGIVPNVYGSTTFDDPAHFDFDLSLVGTHENKGVEKKINGWVKELAKSWKQVGTDGHIHYINFERLERYANAFQRNERKVVDKADEDIFLYLFYGSSVLIGNYAYSEREAGDEFRAKYLEIVKQSPILLAYTAFNLEQSLIERETRRAGVGDHQTGEDRFKQQLVAEQMGIDIDRLRKALEHLH